MVNILLSIYILNYASTEEQWRVQGGAQGARTPPP